jgi:hypothetical protein
VDIGVFEGGGGIAVPSLLSCQPLSILEEKLKSRVNQALNDWLTKCLLSPNLEMLQLVLFSHSRRHKIGYDIFQIFSFTDSSYCLTLFSHRVIKVIK